MNSIQTSQIEPLKALLLSGVDILRVSAGRGRPVSRCLREGKRAWEGRMEENGQTGLFFVFHRTNVL